MHYVIYKITNQIDGKFYVGSHKTKNLNDNYMGSGKYLKYAIKKYGIENFKKEILFVFDNSKQMYEKEAEIVNEEFLASQNTYNIKIGGFGGWDYLNEKYWTAEKKLEHNRKITPFKNKKFVEQNKHKWEKRILEGSKKGNKILSEMRKNGWKSTGFKNKKHSLETKKNIGTKNSIKQQGKLNSQYGTMWITNGIDNKKIKKCDEIPQNWRAGRTVMQRIANP